MSSYVIERLREELDIRFAKGLRDTKILLVGMAYKKNVDDVRESPSIIIYELLKKCQAIVEYYDSHVLEIPIIPEHIELVRLKSVTLTQAQLQTYDAVVICTDQDDVNYDFIVENSKLVIDTRNAIQNKSVENSHVVKA